MFPQLASLGAKTPFSLLPSLTGVVGSATGSSTMGIAPLSWTGLNWPRMGGVVSCCGNLESWLFAVYTFVQLYVSQ